MLKKLLLDVLFPISCVGCHREGIFLCDRCMAGVKISDRSHDDLPQYIDDMLILFEYEKKSALAQLIHDFKYRFSFEIKSSIDVLLSSRIDCIKEFFGDAIIVPVPLFKKRLKWRGFNQAELIAEIIARVTGRPLVHILKRTRHTAPQAELSREARLTNVSGAFVMGKNVTLPRTVVLVDDVTSTGSTLSACAHALKSAGVTTVRGFALARGA